MTIDISDEEIKAIRELQAGLSSVFNDPLNKLIAHYEATKQTWISVDEGLPESDVGLYQVLYTQDETNCVSHNCKFLMGRNWYIDGQGFDFDIGAKVTHYRKELSLDPLPSPPTEQTGES